MVQLDFTGKLNTSVQVGDIAYYVNTSTSGEFTTNSATPILIGTVKSITASVSSVGISTFTVNVQEDGPLTPPTTSDFIFFSKDNKVNIGKLTGYYGKAEFKNDSTTQAELFATSCEVTESSK